MTSSYLTKKKNDPEYIELMNFLIEKAKDAKSPLNLTQLAGEFKENSGASQGVSCFVTRIGKARSTIHEMDSVNTETKVKLIFALSVFINENFLKELRMEAHVEVDGKNRITKYIARNGSLVLAGDHSQSAKGKERCKRMNASKSLTDSIDGSQNSMLATEVKSEDSAPDDSDRTLGLSDMPIEVVDNIVGRLNLLDKLSTRKVCRTLRAIIDHQPSQFQCAELLITIESSRIRYEQEEISYTARGEGNCLLHTPQKSVSLEGDHWEMAIKDFVSVIANPKWKFGTMNLSFYWKRVGEEENSRPYLLLNSLLSDHNIHVEHFQIGGYTMQPAATILQRIKTDSLKILHFLYEFFSEEWAEKIFGLDQWKNAKELDLTKVNDWFPIEKLFHCEKFHIWEIDINEDRLVKMRDILFKSPTFESCTFFYDMTSLQLENVRQLNNRVAALRAAIDRVMGAHTAYNPLDKRYQIEGSNDYFSLSIIRTSPSVFEFKIERVRR